MKKILITAIAVSALLSLGTAMADPDNGNGNQGCNDPATKNPGKAFQAYKAFVEKFDLDVGTTPKDLASEYDNVGEYIAVSCRDDT